MDAPRYGDDTTGYEVALNDTPLSSLENVPLKLNGTEQEETIRITVTNQFAPEAKTEYTITVQKLRRLLCGFIFTRLTRRSICMKLSVITASGRMTTERSAFRGLYL